MSRTVHSFEHRISAEIPDGCYQLALGTITVRGDRYLDYKGDWTETRQPGSSVTFWTPYIRIGQAPAWRKEAARPKAQLKQLKAARLKGT